MDSLNSMSFDATMVCVECSVIFLITADSQEYNRGRKYGSPTRCLQCRKKRKLQMEEEERELAQAAAAEATPPPDDAPVPPPVASSPPPAALQPPRSGQMWDAVCSACNHPTKVPFAPKADRPVYCLACYRARTPPRPAL